MIKRAMLYFLVATLLAINYGGVPASAIPPDFGGKEIIRLYDSDGDFRCTGFFIKPPLREPNFADDYINGSLWLLTAGHCVGGGYTTVKVNEYFEIVATLHARIQLSPIHGKKFIDIAVLTIPAGYVNMKVKESRLAEKDAKPYSQVYFHGFPFGIEAIGNYTVMKPKGEEKKFNGKMVHVYGSKVNSGASGSPILNSAGEIVGILWGMSIYGDDVAYYTPVSKIKEVLKLLDLREEAVYPDPFM